MPATRRENADFCVIGAGPAGAIVAAHLSEAGSHVVLVEHGPRLDGEQRRSLYRRRTSGVGPSGVHSLLEAGDPIPYSVAKEDQPPYFYSRVPAVGGASLHWRAFTPRPIRSDLATKKRFGFGRDWPLSYDELEPWLLAAERELGVAAAADNPYASERSGPFPMPPHALAFAERELIAPACKKLGWKLHSWPVAINSVPRAGRSACQGCRACDICPSGARYAADIVHVPRLEATGKARLLDRTHVRRLELERDGSRVIAAHAVDRRDGAAVVLEAKTFVVAAGGVESARLLLLSADPRHEHGLGNAGGALGRRFGDHVLLGSGMVLRRETGVGLGFATAGCDHFRAHALREQRGGFQMVFVPGVYDAKQLISSATAAGSFSLDELCTAARSSLGIATTIETDDAGKLELDPEQKDEFGDPVARLSLPLSSRDRASANGTIGEIQKLADALGALSLWQGVERGELIWGAHPKGACPIGLGPDDGVCDPSLRVFGLDNLYLASSAVFPQFGAANPTLTIAALALRLVAHLKAGAR